MKNTNIKITTGTIESFFKKAKKIAKQADAKKIISEENRIIFEDPTDLIQFLSPKKIALIKAIKEHPANTITNIAKYLNRDIASVSKDIKLMTEFGMLHVEKKINPGHGIAKVIDLTFQKLTLQAIF